MIGINYKIALFSYMIMVAFFSVLREQTLVYFEMVVIFFATVYLIITPKWKSFFPISILVISFLGNFVAPMDNSARFDSDYPSLHTLSMFSGIKCIDLVVLFMGGGAFFKVFNGDSHFPIKKSVLIILLFMVFSSLFIVTFIGDFVYDIVYMLFILRCLMLSLVFYVYLCDLSKYELLFLTKLAISTCISLMFFAHIIHASNPMQRELFGFNVTVAFAGDEYGSVGLLLAALLLIGHNEKRFCYAIVAICFCLAIFAGRKSAVPYFFFVVLMVFFYDNRAKFGFSKKFMLLSEHIYISIALLFISGLDYAPLNIAFHESIGILKPTISSLEYFFQNNALYYLFGIGPFTKYPLIGLDPSFDHPFAFGADAGELYKIKLWFFPFERSLLNFGGLFPCLFLLRLFFFEKHTSASFYISLYAIYLLFLNPVSIVMCISLAIAFAAKRIKRLNFC
ncbi:hypothetical protein [Aeromonas caviae]|uniref:hypothetical protein n=1 Tax=Aeromonas caviae TaxID=648 RepID=UPI00244AC27E|nr:hypothetical protein [Aeromonas caviae]MDH0351904.1 hypothetical protein [Aeromonas caviae]